MLAGLSSEDQQGVSAITNHQADQLCTQYYTFLMDVAEHSKETEIKTNILTYFTALLHIDILHTLNQLFFFFW